MAIKMRFAESSCIGEVQRQCEFCGHQHKYMVEAQGNASDYDVNLTGASPGERAAAAARTALANWQEDHNFGALCPKCRKFSSKYVKNQFPDGYREALVAASTELTALACCLVATLMFLAVVPLLGGMALLIFGSGMERAVGLIGLVVSSAAIAGSWMLLGREDPTTKRIRKRLTPLTDEMVATIVLKEYEGWMSRQKGKDGIYRFAGEMPFQGWPKRWKTLLKSASK